MFVGVCGIRGRKNMRGRVSFADEEERGKKKSESEIIKILNAHATVAVHICMVTVAIVHLCTILHSLMWVFFCSKCVKSVSFFILHNFA